MCTHACTYINAYIHTFGCPLSSCYIIKNANCAAFLLFRSNSNRSSSVAILLFSCSFPSKFPSSTLITAHVQHQTLALRLSPISETCCDCRQFSGQLSELKSCVATKTTSTTTVTAAITTATTKALCSCLSLWVTYTVFPCGSIHKRTHAYKYTY